MRRRAKRDKERRRREEGGGAREGRERGKIEKERKGNAKEKSGKNMFIDRYFA